ncbi:putative reverse transcriptase domain-containing protein [Tanacetum coccineum]
MDEAHKSKYFVHPGADKMYYDLRDMYWWPIMKKDIAVHERIAMDFVTKLPRTSSRYDTIWVIMDRLTNYAYYLPMREDYKMDSVGEYVLLKVSPWEGVIRFGKKGKLAPRFVGPFEIIERIGLVAYRLRLHEELNGVHDTFHVSNLKKCLADPTLQVPLDEIQVDAKLNIVEELVEILEREFKKLKRSRISIVKVKWNSKRGPEFTWERKDQMKLKYSHLFSSSSSYISGSKFFLKGVELNAPAGRLLGAGDIGVETPRSWVYVVVMTSTGMLCHGVMRMIIEVKLQDLADLKSILYGLHSERFGFEFCVEFRKLENCCFKISMDPCVRYIWSICETICNCVLVIGTSLKSILEVEDHHDTFQ